MATVTDANYSGSASGTLTISQATATVTLGNLGHTYDGAAKAAGVFAIAVGWGGIHPDERLLAEEPDAFVRTPQELVDAL